MEVFLCHLLSCDRSELVAFPEKEIPVEHLRPLQTGWVKIMQGVPVAYLTQSKEFYGLSLYVDESVLIPRDATERMVELALERLGQGAKVLEIGTGSGAIAIAMKKTRPDLELTAGEVSAEALVVAKKNAETHQVDIRFIESDLLTEVPQESFDLLIANLPYIGEVEHHFVSETVAQYEPHVALFGGHDGLELYRQLLKQVKDRGHPFKWILGEIGFSQAESMLKVLDEYPEYEAQIVQDYEGLDRIFILTNKSVNMPAS